MKLKFSQRPVVYILRFQLSAAMKLCKSEAMSRVNAVLERPGSAEQRATVPSRAWRVGLLQLASPGAEMLALARPRLNRR